MLMTNLLPNAHEASRPVDKRNQMSSRLLEVSLSLKATRLGRRSTNDT